MTDVTGLTDRYGRRPVAGAFVELCAGRLRVCPGPTQARVLYVDDATAILRLATFFERDIVVTTTRSLGGLPRRFRDILEEGAILFQSPGSWVQLVRSVRPHPVYGDASGASAWRAALTERRQRGLQRAAMAELRALPNLGSDYESARENFNRVACANAHV